MKKVVAKSSIFASSAQRERAAGVTIGWSCFALLMA